jgi:superoxide dismutase, Fe-Mn family
MKLSKLLDMKLNENSYELPELGFSYNSLEPYIDEETMREHHLKHHSGYVDNLNDALMEYPHLRQPLEHIFHNIESYNMVVRNNAGGVWNHTFFWKLLSPDKTTLSGKLKLDILKKWGSIDAFKKEFIDAGKLQFGSGWVWLIHNSYYDTLEIVTTPNQDNPLMKSSLNTPIIGCDVWEHAYYLKHKSDRGKWISTFFDVINWDYANYIYSKLLT